MRNFEILNSPFSRRSFLLIRQPDEEAIQFFSLCMKKRFVEQRFDVDKFYGTKGSKKTQSFTKGKDMMKAKFEIHPSLQISLQYIRSLLSLPDAT